MKKSHWKGLLCLLFALMLAGCAKTEALPETQEAATAPSAAETTAPAPEETEAPVSILSYGEFMAAPLDSPVTIETYVQGRQALWDNKTSVYCQGPDGAYFLYNLNCSQEDAEKLTLGTKIRVSGYKAAHRGEIEIMEGSFSFVDGETYIAQPYDVTDLLGTGQLIDHRNKRVCFRGLTVAPSLNESGKKVPFLYKEDGSGEPRDDLYFTLTDGKNSILCTVSRYLLGTGRDSEVYQAVEQLKVGDVVDITGFLHWRDKALLTVTALTPAP